MKPTFKIFVSSPSDVSTERYIVDSVIKYLSRKYESRVNIEPFLWEKEPLEANKGSFQDSITPVEKCHLVIAIIWNRIGFPLGKFDKNSIDQRFYPPTWIDRNPTGTEYEIVKALQAYKATVGSDEEKRFPDLLVYRKTAIDNVLLSEAKEAGKQFDEAETFFSWLTRDNVDGSFTTAFFKFEAPNQFEEILKEHLEKWIIKKLKLKIDDIKATPIWLNGSPFRSLQPFDVEHSDIFFGRQQETYLLLDQFRALEKEQKALMVVMGVSGSGKSSLLRAGVVANLYNRKNENWKYTAINPGIGAHPFETLVNTIYTDLKLFSPTKREIQLEIAKKSREALALSVSEYLENQKAKYFILIDQFEELFTGNYDKSELLIFSNALIELAKNRQIWIAVTLRSDYYHCLETLPTFFEFIREKGFYHLKTPSHAGLDLIVRKPVLIAGLRYEEKDGIGLDQVIIEEVKELGDCLPLLEFTLNRLYDVGYEDGILAYEEYDSIGRIGGSINKHAKNTIAALDKESRERLPFLLDQLIGVDAEGRSMRLYPARSEFGKNTPIEHLINVLVKERLLTAGTNSDKQPTVALAHDLLLTHWDEIQSHFQRNQQALKDKQWLKNAAARWKSENKNNAFLLNTNKLIDKAEIQLVYQMGNEDCLVTDYVNASVAQKKKNIWGWIGLIIADICLLYLLFALIGGILSTSIRNIVIQDYNFLELWEEIYNSSLENLIGCIPLLILIIWLNIRIISPLNTLDNVRKERNIIWAILLTDLLSTIVNIFDQNADLLTLFITSLVIMSIWVTWLLNNYYIRKKVRLWKEKRYAIKTLNPLKKYLKPIANSIFWAAVVMFILLFIGVKSEEEKEFLSSNNLYQTINQPWEYNSGVILSLLEDGANIDRQNERGQAVLHLASFNNDSVTIEKLLSEYHANIEIEDNFGNTPFMTAVSNKSRKAFNALLNYSPNINHQNKDGFSPLLLAVQNNDSKIIDSLIKLGADINHKTKIGYSAPYLAARIGNIKALACLWKETENDVLVILNNPLDKSRDMSSEVVSLIAGYKRWQGDHDESVAFYDLALSKTEGDTLNMVYILYELAGTILNNDPSDEKGILLLKKCYSLCNNDWLKETIGSSLLWHLVQFGYFDEAYPLAKEIMSKIDTTDISPTMMNISYALFFKGDTASVFNIHKRNRNKNFYDGRSWRSEVYSDFAQLGWLGVGNEMLGYAKKKWEIKTMKLSYLLKPQTITDPELNYLKNKLIGTWRCEDRTNNVLLSFKWEVGKDGFTIINIYDAENNGLIQKTKSEWRLGFNENNRLIIAERFNNDGAITKATIDFRNNYTELLLTLHETTYQFSDFKQRLYRRIK